MGERESPASNYETALSPIRAVRSLAWNRRVLPIIQARLERAESVVRAHLLLNGNSCLRIGAYEISLNGDEEIIVHQVATDDWQQLPLPESRLPSVNLFKETESTFPSEEDPSKYVSKKEPA